MSSVTSKIKVNNNYQPFQPLKSRRSKSYVEGLRKDLTNYAIGDVNNEYKSKLDTNHYLPPPPRSQNVIDPVFSLLKDSPYQSTPYKYGMTLQNGIAGVVQYQVNNSNFARGNQFSLGEAVKRLNYTAEIPVVDSAHKKTIVTNSPFYPYPNYALTFNKDYMTYAHPKRYQNGQPIIEAFGSKTANRIGLIVIILVILFLVKLFL